MRTSFWLAGLLVAFFFSGCAGRRMPSAREPARSGPNAFPAATNAAATTQELIVSPEQGLSGTVARANADLRFVVLNFPIGHLPPIERRLVVYRRGLKVGEIKVSGPQLDDNIVADIVAGEAAPGDEVRNQ